MSPRRPSDVGTLTVAIGPRERDCCDAMKAATGIATDADLVRLALYRLAAHLDQHTDTALFACRVDTQSKRRAMTRGRTA